MSSRPSTWPTEPAWLTASITPSLRRVAGPARVVDDVWASERSCVGERRSRRRHRTSRCRRRRRPGRCRGRSSAAALAASMRPCVPMLLLVSNAMTVVRRTCSSVEPANSALESSTVSPIDTVTSSGLTVEPSGTETSTWIVLSSPGSTCPMERSPSAAGPPGRSTGAPRRRPPPGAGVVASDAVHREEHRVDGARRRAPASRGTSGAGPVDRRLPGERPSSSKPAA